MEKQIYGNITNTARTQFQFDKIYPNRAAMDDACLNDGIYAGRYVLVEYDENPSRGATELIKKGANLFYYKDFENVQAIPGKTVAVGQIYYTVDEATGKHSFYESVESKNEDGTITPQFILLTTSPSLDNYDTNWKIDYSKYKRGFDSTVWQKVYDKGSQVYIMVAELNTVVPNFTISADAPTETALAPHIDNDSTNLNVNIHMPTQWGMRVASAENNNLSDEKVEHEYIKYDNLGNEIKEIKENIPANIFYNKEGLEPYRYIKIKISEKDGDFYAPGKYYYKVDQGVYKKSEEPQWLPEFDNKIFYQINDNIPEEDQLDYYTNLENLEIIELVKSYEIKYEPGKFYYLNYETYIVALEPFDPTKTYFQRVEDKKSVNDYNYIPVNITEEDYNNFPGEYYLYLAEYKQESEDAVFSKSKQYFDENGNLYENIVDKPEYQSNKYYTWADYYYAIDNSPEEIRDRQYYIQDEKTKEYIPVSFEYRSYLPYTYFYEENEEYILDRSAEADTKKTYYRKALPVIREGKDKISVLPTGISGRLYNNCQYSTAVEDIQEISIILPSIGKTIAEVWNKMYGEERNDLIYSSPFYDPLMYKSSGEPLYDSNFHTFVGLINKMHDLIGHNIIELINEECISIDSEDNSVIINNEKSNIVNKKNLNKYIYSINGKNYRAILNDNKILLIPMDSIEDTDEAMDNIYEVLLEIQKTLGMNENASIASSNSVKGALLHLNEIIDNLSEGLEVLAIGEGLGSQHERIFRDIDGNYLKQEYNPNTFVAAKDYYEYFIDYYRKKELIIYSKNQVTVNSDTFSQGQYWIETTIEEKIKYVLAKTFTTDTTYYIFEKIGKFTNIPSQEELEDKYIIDLPRYYLEIYNEIEERTEKIYKDHLNVLEDIVELDRYMVYHEDPASSSDTAINKIYGVLKKENNHSVLNEINVNGKGHVYGEGSSYILPQVIVSADEPSNVPIGTLWYKISESN